MKHNLIWKQNIGSGVFFVGDSTVEYATIQAIAEALQIDVAELSHDGKMSFDDIREAINEQLNKLSKEGPLDVQMWVSELYSDHVIVCDGCDHWSVSYTMSGNEAVLGEDWTEVERVWLEVSEAGSVYKVERGEKYPSSAYAYVPDANKPSTWKLRLWESPSKKETIAQLGRAAAAFSKGGFRGKKVQLPADAVAKVKSKIRAAYKALGAKKEDIPASIAEAEITVSESVVAFVESPQILGLSEAGSNDLRRWNVVLISAGVTESANINISHIVGKPATARKEYPAEVLESAATKGMFDGAVAIQRTVDQHLSRTGGSEKNIVGWYDRVSFSEGKVKARFNIRNNKAGRQMQTQMAEAHAGKRKFPEFSITGDAKVSISESDGGFIAHVKELVEISSVDPVPSGNAGGRVESISESKIEQFFQEIDMKAKLLALLKEKRPDLLNGVDEATITEAELEVKVAEAMKPPVPAAAATTSDAERRVAELQQRLDLQESRVRVDVALAESKLPKPIQNKLQKQLTKRVMTEAEISEAINAEKDAIGQLTPLSVGEFNTSVEAGAHEDEKFFHGMVGLVEGKPQEIEIGGKKHRISAMSSIRKLYIELTGDEGFTGIPKRNARMFGLAESMVRMQVVPAAFIPAAESLDSASFSSVLASVLYRRLVGEYNFAPYDYWRPLVSIVPLADFRTQHRVRYGGYGDLPTVLESGNYTALDSPTDEEATYAPTKKGGTEDITLEMIANDDVGAVRRIPQKLGRSAKRTLCNFVMNFLRNGFSTAIYDGVFLFHAGSHGNLGTTAFGYGSLSTGYQAIMKQAEKNVTGGRLGIPPKYVVFPIDLQTTVLQTIGADKTTEGTTILSNYPNFMQNKLTPIMDVLATDATDWFLLTDPADVETIEVGFFSGEEMPSLFLQDMPNVGSMFTNDKLTYKIRHIYGGSVVDYRGMYGAQVS